MIWQDLKEQLKNNDNINDFFLSDRKVFRPEPCVKDTKDCYHKHNDKFFDEKEINNALEIEKLKKFLHHFVDECKKKDFDNLKEIRDILSYCKNYVTLSDLTAILSDYYTKCVSDKLFGTKPISKHTIYCIADKVF